MGASLKSSGRPWGGLRVSSAMGLPYMKPFQDSLVHASAEYCLLVVEPSKKGISSYSQLGTIMFLRHYLLK